MRSYTRTNRHTHSSTHPHTYARTHTHTHTHTHTSAHTHTCPHIHTRARTHACTHTHTYTRTHTLLVRDARKHKLTYCKIVLSCARIYLPIFTRLSVSCTLRAQVLCESRGGRPAGPPVPNKPTVSVDVKQHLTNFLHTSVNRQFSDTCGVTSYVSGWRKDVVNQCLVSPADYSPWCEHRPWGKLGGVAWKGAGAKEGGGGWRVACNTEVQYLPKVMNMSLLRPGLQGPQELCEGRGGRPGLRSLINLWFLWT